MIKLTLLLLFFIIFIKKNICWSDEPHMIVSAIAYYNLNDKEKRILNKIFLNYKEDRDFNDPITGALWADHIKSNEHSTVNPSDIRRYEILDIFNEWHFVQIPYNPTKMFLPHYYLNAHKGKYNAMGVLKYIYKILIQVQKKPRHGTYFSYNFYLRFFIHIFADIHQPLHTISFYNEHFPNGDKGGSDITLNYHGQIGKLHHLCDNIFYSRKKHWPHINPSILQKEAHVLMNMYPPEHFGSKLTIPSNKIDFIDSIANESHQLAIEHIYSHIPVRLVNKDMQIKVDQHFVINLKGILNKQMVLAGYRLSLYLKDIIANIPEDL
ncbi:p1/s1 nuclease, putative [Plasmodium gallinaceum]|uniref:P1/s1 nuclease, putative n=1 Tax=Plasmodium gallinaceum TaxID=5849 RepID=A0A1J1GT65_PLAGA|nr:p1/s1 nuclease, putative [Plasmodium gallinaceum]CRG95639.1 p1/s1 nuclease, putative [Plasmodium gallinaceum]